MRKSLQTIGVALAATLIMAGIAVPAQGATSTGYRACSSTTTVSLTTYTHSALTHTHTYIPAAGNQQILNRRGVTTGGTQSAFQQANWRATNNSTEAWRLTPRVSCLTRPL